MTENDEPGEATEAGATAARRAEDARHATALAQPLVGQSLNQLCLGVGDVQLRFSGGYGVTLEGGIEEVTRAGHVILPFALDGVALLLPLLNQDVTSVRVSREGALSLTIGGSLLRCNGDPDYEAWQLNGPRGELVVSVPGGGLAIWSQRG